MFDVEQWITGTRFEQYLVAANRDRETALRLYEWNASVSAAFFELISYVEVALRNSIDVVLRESELARNARVREERGWWFGNPAFLDEAELKFFERAKVHLKSGWLASGRDRVLSAMTFGLWADMFSKRYDALFRSQLVHAFGNHPPEFTRKSVHAAVLPLKNLRNRIAHHQPIFEEPLGERYEQAMSLLRWIDPELERWVSGTSGNVRLVDLLSERPLSPPPTAVIVPAKDAWPFYKDNSAYICQAGRYFQPVSHMGFYYEGRLQASIALIKEKVPHVSWRREKIEELIKTGSARNKRIADLIRKGLDKGWVEGVEYDVYLLTSIKDDPESGHIELPAPIPNKRSGRGSAWVQRQRYVSIDDLRAMKFLS